MNKEKKAESRRKVILYDRRNAPAGTAFKTSDQHAFKVQDSGAFIRLDKDRRSVKERKRARRNAREGSI